MKTSTKIGLAMSSLPIIMLYSTIIFKEWVIITANLHGMTIIDLQICILIFGLVWIGIETWLLITETF